MINPGVEKTSENDYEKYTRWYLEDLKEAGYVENFYREYETFQVLPAYNYKKEKHYVRKENSFEDFNLIQSTNYTYDFLIVWTQKAINVFTEIMYSGGHFIYGLPLFVSHYREFDNVKKIVSYVDVKPHGQAARFSGSLSTYYTFPYVQKILLHNYHIYVNKIVPINTGKHGRTSCLFASSFTPKRYYYTDISMKERKLTHKPVRSLKSFVQNKLKIINDLKIQNERKSEKKSQNKLDL